jgi:hypothetical protein
MVIFRQLNVININIIYNINIFKAPVDIFFPLADFAKIPAKKLYFQ